MTILAIGVMGHVDHGKTALVRALTGTDTDRLPEEKARGISIALGFALLRVGEAEIDLIDMPGHERFLRTMVAGAAGIGAVLVVVSALEGPRAQTREHLEIAGLLGLRRAVVAVSFCDRATPDQARLAGVSTAALAIQAGLQAPPVLLTAARTGLGVTELAAALADLARAVPPPIDLGLAQLPVDRAFALPGIGPVVTGTLRRGRLAVGEEVELNPGGRPVRVRSLQVHGKPVAAAPPGRRVAVALRGVEIGALSRGMVLASPGAARPGEWLDARLEVLGSALAPVADGATLRLLTGTMEVAARLRLPTGGVLPPGEAALVQLRCDPPVVAMAGDGFVLRLASPSRSIGGGVILDPGAVRRRRTDRAALPRLEAAAAGDWAEATLCLLRECGGARPQEWVPRLGHAAAQLRRWALAGGAREVADGTLLHPGTWESILSGLRATLAAFHAAQPMEAGMRPEALRATLPAGLADAAAAALVEAAGLRRDPDGLLRLPDFDPVQAMAAEARGLTVGLAALFRRAGLSPPDAAAVVAGDRTRAEALRFLLQRGVLVRATDTVQHRFILFHRDAVAEAQRRLAGALDRPEGFAVGEAGALLGISRKFSIPLLEHLDSLRFTRRAGDRRYIEGDAAARRSAAEMAR
ncbi:selenocysteine-specific translation elongation factor [Dankookia rubra]|uniref:Selenocysteine-specific elongation factor n=1 Tax=Dankookia rubra TaxID=1442381 RepID=A0A4R5QDI5_9PROT|nr:selenocysteine-specific translation elongation factor [Dankookia rubra]TDH60873.1 selenocysteine-specific translation elongation factor [Dankookia rubra]